MTPPQRALLILADALGVALATLSETPTIATCDSWDSIGHTRLVLALEAHIGAQLETSTILSLTDIDAIARALEQAGPA